MWSATRVIVFLTISVLLCGCKTDSGSPQQEYGAAPPKSTQQVFSAKEIKEMRNAPPDQMQEVRDSLAKAQPAEKQSDSPEAAELHAKDELERKQREEQRRREEQGRQREEAARKAAQNERFTILQREVRKTLGSSNRLKVRPVTVKAEGGDIEIVFAVNDNFTRNMIRAGAKIDIVRVLKAVQSSGYDYSEIAVGGSFPLADKFGNTQETIVFRAAYRRTTVNRINWDGFLFENVYDIADSTWIHPAFQ